MMLPQGHIQKKKQTLKVSKTSKVENIYKAAYFPNFVLFIFPLKVPALLNCLTLCTTFCLLPSITLNIKVFM